MFQSRKVAKQFVASEQSEGRGARVRRSIGSFKLRNLDPFLMLDEFSGSLPGGFPDHPHRGFETVSYILPTSKGSSNHEDFLGNKGTLHPGDLQWMTAGRGIIHSEMPASFEATHGLQLWINLPRAKKLMAPRYQDVNGDTVPIAYDVTKKVQARVFAGEVFGSVGPIASEAPVTYVHFIMQPDSTLEYKIPTGHNALVYTIFGTGVCAGAKAQAHEAIALEKEGDGVTVSTTDGMEFIVLSGQPLNEPVVQHGPFVMNTEDEIRQAFFDYHSGKNGFENAPGWTSELWTNHIKTYGSQ